MLIHAYVLHDFYASTWYSSCSAYLSDLNQFLVGASCASSYIEWMSSFPTGKVSRGVNISTSVLSEHTERSFYGNPDEDLAHIVRTMTEAFPKEPAKCKDCCIIAQSIASSDELLLKACQNAIDWHNSYPKTSTIWHLLVSYIVCSTLHTYRLFSPRWLLHFFLLPPHTVEAASMGDGLLSAAARVSRSFSSYSQELMGKWQLSSLHCSSFSHPVINIATLYSDLYHKTSSL